jgi:hypothetical protein
MESASSEHRGYVISDNPEEKAVIVKGLEALKDGELSQIPEGRIRYDHLHRSASQDVWPGAYVSSTGRPVHVRHSEHQFFRAGPAELPLALAAAEKMQNSSDSAKRQIAEEIAAVLRDELEAFKSSCK